LIVEAIESTESPRSASETGTRCPSALQCRSLLELRKRERAADRGKSPGRLPPREGCRPPPPLPCLARRPSPKGKPSQPGLHAHERNEID
jgi:hypothetical protein